MRLFVTAVAVAACLVASSSTSAQQAAGSPEGWLSMMQNAAAQNAAAEVPAAPASATSTVREPPPQAAQPKLWEIKFKVYGWIPGYNGRAGGPGGRTTTVDITYGDVLDSLDKIESMVPLNLEVRYGRWGAYADLFYAKLEASVRRDGLSADVTGSQTILEIGGFYRLATCSACCREDSLCFDILGGARYNRLTGSLGLQTPDHVVDLAGKHQWWDPFVGPRVTWQATDRLSLFARADVGGFGIENCSKFAWQFVGAVDYDICKNLFLELGYRLLDTDFRHGSGAGKFTYDVLQQGPYLAVGLKF